MTSFHSVYSSGTEWGPSCQLDAPSLDWFPDRISPGSSSFSEKSHDIVNPTCFVLLTQQSTHLSQAVISGGTDPKAPHWPGAPAAGRPECRDFIYTWDQGKNDPSPFKVVTNWEYRPPGITGELHASEPWLFFPEITPAISPTRYWLQPRKESSSIGLLRTEASSESANRLL